MLVVDEADGEDGGGGGGAAAAEAASEAEAPGGIPMVGGSRTPGADGIGIPDSLLPILMTVSMSCHI
jgi:hypothetical protein